jgi:hypothetical protein
MSGVPSSLGGTEGDTQCGSRVLSIEGEDETVHNLKCSFGDRMFAACAFLATLVICLSSKGIKLAGWWKG